MQKTKANPSLNKADLERTRAARVKSGQDRRKISGKWQRYRLSGNLSSLSPVLIQIIPTFVVAFCKHKIASESIVSTLPLHRTADHQHITLEQGQIAGPVRLEDGAQFWKARVKSSHSRMGEG